MPFLHFASLDPAHLTRSGFIATSVAKGRIHFRMRPFFVLKAPDHRRNTFMSCPSKRVVSKSFRNGGVVLVKRGVVAAEPEPTRRDSSPHRKPQRAHEPLFLLDDRRDGICLIGPRRCRSCGVDAVWTCNTNHGRKYPICRACYAGAESLSSRDLPYQDVMGAVFAPNGTTPRRR